MRQSTIFTTEQLNFLESLMNEKGSPTQQLLSWQEECYGATGFYFSKIKGNSYRFGVYISDENKVMAFVRETKGILLIEGGMLWDIVEKFEKLVLEDSD